MSRTSIKRTVQKQASVSVELREIVMREHGCMLIFLVGEKFSTLMLKWDGSTFLDGNEISRPTLPKVLADAVEAFGSGQLDAALTALLA